LTVKLAEVPLKLTAVAPVKFVPVITTVAPTAPLVGSKPVIVGALAVGVGVGVVVGVEVGVDGIAVGVRVGVAVGAIAVGVRVGVRVGVAVGAIAVGVRVGVAVGVRVGVRVGVAVGVRVGVAVGVRVGVAVGTATVGVGVEVAVTVIETVFVVLLSDPSFALNVKLSLPLKLEAGEYVTEAVQVQPVPPAAQLGAPIGPSVPCAGLLTIEKFKLELSGSDAESVIVFGVSSLVVTD
jgi:hypothetical protein